MAKFKPILGELRGSVAAVTASSGRGGAYLKLRGMPVNGNDAAHQLQRGRIAASSAAWRRLTDQQRIAWAQWAELHPQPDVLGTSVRLAGHAAFVRHNAIARAAGFPAVTDPPIDVLLPVLYNWAATPSGLGQIIVGAVPAPLPAGVAMQLLASPPGTAGRDPNAASLRSVGFTTVDLGGGTYGFPSAGLGLPGQWVNLWARLVDNQGQQSVPHKLRVQLE